MSDAGAAVVRPGQRVAVGEDETVELGLVAYVSPSANSTIVDRRAWSIPSGVTVSSVPRANGVLHVATGWAVVSPEYAAAVDVPDPDERVRPTRQAD